MKLKHTTEPKSLRPSAAPETKPCSAAAPSSAVARRLPGPGATAQNSRAPMLPTRSAPSQRSRSTGRDDERCHRIPVLDPRRQEASQNREGADAQPRRRVAAVMYLGRGTASHRPPGVLGLDLLQQLCSKLRHPLPADPGPQDHSTVSAGSQLCSGSLTGSRLGLAVYKFAHKPLTATQTGPVQTETLKRHKAFEDRNVKCPRDFRCIFTAL